MGHFENANRLAEYKAARQKGAGPREAALLSREISTDFAMRGSSETMRVLAVAIPFLNARLQGLYGLGRLGFRDNVVAFAAKGFMLTAATLALMALNWEDERYRDLPEDRRDLYWFIPFGSGEDDFVLIPKPFETGMIFGTIPERIWELWKTGDEKEFADAIGWMMLETFNLDLVPQVFQPMQDLRSNRGFSGSPIVPFYLDGVKSTDQFTYYTSRTARAIGGTSMADKLNLSPIAIDHLIRGYVGTLGAYSLGASDALIRHTAGDIPGEGEQPTRGETWRENLHVRAVADPLVGEGPPRRTKGLTDLYELAKETEEIAKTFALRVRLHSTNTADLLNDPENAALFAANDAVQDARAQLSELRITMQNVRQAPDLSGDEKRVRMWNIQRAINDVARRASTEIQRELEKLKGGS